MFESASNGLSACLRHSVLSFSATVGSPARVTPCKRNIFIFVHFSDAKDKRPSNLALGVFVKYQLAVAGPLV